MARFSAFLVSVRSWPHTCSLWWLKDSYIFNVFPSSVATILIFPESYISCLFLEEFQTSRKTEELAQRVAASPAPRFPLLTGDISLSAGHHYWTNSNTFWLNIVPTSSRFSWFLLNVLFLFQEPIQDPAGHLYCFWCSRGFISSPCRGTARSLSPSLMFLFLDMTTLQGKTLLQGSLLKEKGKQENCSCNTSWRTRALSESVLDTEDTVAIKTQKSLPRWLSHK